MTEKLKPCPFCGGKAKYISTTEDMHWVYCRDCKCKTSEHYGYCGKEFSIGYWNTRANCKENLEVLSGHKTSPDEVYSYFVSFDYNNGRERGLGSCAIKNCNEKNITANLIERFRNILEEKGFGNVVIINVIKLDG